MTTTLADPRTNEKFKTVKQHFNKSVHSDLQALIEQNVNWDDEFSKHFDTALLSRYQAHSALLKSLNQKATPSSGHIVKVICQNGRVYEQALLRFYDGECQVTVNGGGFIHQETLTINGLSMSVYGGYTLKIDTRHLRELDSLRKNYRFSGTGRIEANCGINISLPIKRWILDDSDGQLGFY